jgi:hypothetical protein
MTSNGYALVVVVAVMLAARSQRMEPPGPEDSRRDDGQRAYNLLERRCRRSPPGTPRVQAKNTESTKDLPAPTRDPARLTIPLAVAAASACPGSYRLPDIKKGQGSAGSPLPRTQVLERKGPRTQKTR